MANYYSQNQNAEMGWDGTIDYAESFTVLPEGDYQFRVTNITQARHEGSAKIPPCKKIIAEFTLISPDGQEGSAKENFLLHSNMVWKLSQFFVSVGMMQKNQKGFQMKWMETIGKTGMCRVSVNKYTGTDGQEHQNNRIEKFYPAEEKPLSEQPASFMPYQPSWKG